MQIDINDLQDKLENLTGLDFEKAQKNFKAKYKDDSFGVIQLNSNFQIELAALALDENPNELKNLPLKKYVSLCNEVQRFLFADSVEETAATD